MKSQFFMLEDFEANKSGENTPEKLSDKHKALKHQRSGEKGGRYL